MEQRKQWMMGTAGRARQGNGMAWAAVIVKMCIRDRYTMATEAVNNLLRKRGLSVDTNAYRGPKRLDPETRAFVEIREEAPPVSAKERREAAQKARAQAQKENEKD